jgi:hypothetical protein
MVVYATFNTKVIIKIGNKKLGMEAYFCRD